MKFCFDCGHELTVGIPPLDNMPRYICPNCKKVHYENPKIVVCSVPFIQTAQDLSVLLCRRAIEPREGFWTLPGGFMENGETTEQAARRETLEEAGADVQIGSFYSLFNLPAYNQVHMFYLAHMKNMHFSPGEESLEVKLFTQEQIPWGELAFPTITQTLKFFFQDKNKFANIGALGIHTYDFKR